MVTITEDLVRKRAEHNECQIFSLEEISLHQQDIEKIENLDRWCRDLKILYLQSNLIGKIENVGRLKKLEYLNLALNNVEKVENLQGCESLKKLDLTVNFVGEITSLESLKKNVFLEELYLTGNPCATYEGYREYVVVTLPQLKYLDGVQIEKSERIQGHQEIKFLQDKILQQQEDYLRKREVEKQEYNKTNESSVESKGEDNDDKYWNEKVGYTPESRTEIQNKMRENKEKKTKPMFEKPDYKRKIRFFNDDGEPINVNEAKIDFELTESEDDSSFLLDVACPKYMDTSLIDVDVQPYYVRVTMKGKSLQLVLFEEIKPDSGSAKRSQITGHLLLTMPKLNPPIIPTKTPIKNETDKDQENKKPEKKVTRERLEVDESKSIKSELANITKEKKLRPLGAKNIISKRSEIETTRDNDKDFVDNFDVPPLE